MKYHIITYGCQMNKSDSERIATKLEKQGYKPVKADSPAEALAKAGLIVINVCSVRQAAINRVIGQIKNIKTHPQRQQAGLRGGQAKIVLTGCILPQDKKKFAKQVDEIWPQADLDVIPKCLSKKIAYIPIMTGCNNFCSYCAVPYTRGREKSRKASKILKEAKRLIKLGYNEIMLLGQNVNSYSDFPELLKSIADLDGNFKLSFMTSHPKDMSDKLIKIIAESDKISKEIHLPVQSGDDQILKKMNRGYTSAHYKNLIKKIRTNIPQVKISTDIIVGFPSETKKQFENTVSLCKQIKFEKAYISQYSPRTGTYASKLKDDISHQEKKRRWLVLDKLINRK